MSSLYVYCSPLGDILLESGGETLTGLWFKGQKHCPPFAHAEPLTAAHEAVKLAAGWLDKYFSGQRPGSTYRLRRRAGTQTGTAGTGRRA